MNSLIINRHNYEELFLLYLDDELSAEDCKVVENFVNQNKDLGQELEILKNSKLNDEAIFFNEKDILYKKENGISISNHQEYFLLSSDNELNEKERNDVEKFVLKHPALQEEFTLLQQTKLEPETITFIAKEKLYRTEKERRIIPIIWMKISVAAAILGFVVAAWILNNGSIESGHTTVAVKENMKEKKGGTDEKLVGGSVIENPVPKPVVSNKNNIEIKNIAITTKKEVILKSENHAEAVKKGKISSKKQAQNNQVSEQNNDILVAETKVSQELNSPLNVNKIKNQEAPTIEDTRNKNEPVLAKQPVIEEQSVLVTHAVYKEIDNSDEEDRSIYIGGSQINKNKLKGLFKKAVSLFDKKNTKKDSEQTM